jgi:AAA+ ATPase superfamily predicted ATPase
LKNNMKFYDREAELAALENACAAKGSEMTIVSGRRRIGKSRLINEFLNKDHAKVSLLCRKKRNR